MELYCCTIDGLEALPGLELLSPARQAHTLRYAHAEDRARSLAAGLLLRHALGAEAAARIETAEKGKPYLPGGPCFNLSHSGRYVALAVNAGEVGLDVEQIAPFDERVAARCYTEAERAWLYAEADPVAAFYRLWVAKESIMKATGQGFSMPPASFSVLPMQDGPHTIAGHTWHLAWHALPGHALAIASERAETATRIELKNFFTLSC